MDQWNLGYEMSGMGGGVFLCMIANISQFNCERLSSAIRGSPFQVLHLTAVKVSVVLAVLHDIAVG